MLRYLEVISQETSRCGDIVRNLLSFARQQEGKLAEQRLGAVVERALLIVHHHLELANINLEQKLTEDDEAVCDGGQIQQALVALLVNAVEAMPDGGTLTVKLTSDPDTVELSVRDTGVGIPEEVRPHIFEPFVSTKGDTKGVGLGLAVVYGIVHRHGGDITVESDVGRGTCFRLTLPRDARALDQEAGAPSVPQPSLVQPLSNDGVS
jgi:two-component system NtrC family sensor kinase